MKHLLAATAALATVAAGAASADVSVGGDGRMGVLYNDSAAEEFQFTSRIRIAFTASGTTDGGLTFGGSIRADNSNVRNCTLSSSSGSFLTGLNVTTTVVDSGAGFTTVVENVTANVGSALTSASVSCANGGGVVGQAGNVFISGAFGRLSMGDVSGAAEFMVGDLHSVGLTGLGDFNEIFYLANGGNSARSAARYDYSMGDFRFALSADNPGSGADVYSVAVGYSMNGFGINLGYEDASGAGGLLNITHWVLGANATLGDIALRAIYAEADVTVGPFPAGNYEQYGVSASGNFSGIGITGFYRRDFAETDHMGIGASFDLGGGAVLRGGIVNSDPVSGGDTTQADFGVAFTF